MPRNGDFQIIVPLLYAHYPVVPFYHANSIAMLYVVHKYKKKFESDIFVNFGITCNLKCFVFSNELSNWQEMLYGD